MAEKAVVDFATRLWDDPLIRKAQAADGFGFSGLLGAVSRALAPLQLVDLTEEELALLWAWSGRPDTPQVVPPELEQARQKVIAIVQQLTELGATVPDKASPIAGRRRPITLADLQT